LPDFKSAGTGPGKLVGEENIDERLPRTRKQEQQKNRQRQKRLEQRVREAAELLQDSKAEYP